MFIFDPDARNCRRCLKGIAVSLSFLISFPVDTEHLFVVQMLETIEGVLKAFCTNNSWWLWSQFPVSKNQIKLNINASLSVLLRFSILVRQATRRRNCRCTLFPFIRSCVEISSGWESWTLPSPGDTKMSGRISLNIRKKKKERQKNS